MSLNVVTLSFCSMYRHVDNPKARLRDPASGRGGEQKNKISKNHLNQADLTGFWRGSDQFGGPDSNFLPKPRQIGLFQLIFLVF